MSVTLKLSDEDAAVVGSVLRVVASTPMQKGDGSLDYFNYYNKLRQAHSSRTLELMGEIAGAFRVATRANQR